MQIGQRTNRLTRRRWSAVCTHWRRARRRGDFVTAPSTRMTKLGRLHPLIQIKELRPPRCGLMRPKGQQACFGLLQQESNNDQVICCCLRTGLGVIGAGYAPGAPPTAGRDCHSSPRSMRTGYAPHCEWCLHQNSHPTCRQQVRSWSDLLISRGRRRAASNTSPARSGRPL
jgi:hypothetical protein